MRIISNNVAGDKYEFTKLNQDNEIYEYESDEEQSPAPLRRANNKIMPGIIQIQDVDASYVSDEDIQIGGGDKPVKVDNYSTEEDQFDTESTLLEKAEKKQKEDEKRANMIQIVNDRIKAREEKEKR